MRENRLRVHTGSLRETGAAAAVMAVLKEKRSSHRVRTYGNSANLLDGVCIFPLLTPSQIKTSVLCVRDFKH